MPRDLPIGNGTVLAAFDRQYRIRELYYPRVGKENHALGFPWHFGIWVNGVFSWIGSDPWILDRRYVPDTLVTAVTASHPRLPVRLQCNDVVDYESNVLVRQVRVENLSDQPLEVRLFFHADLNALENEIGDTAFFDPKNAAIVHYKGPRYFMMSCTTAHALGVTDFAIGNKRHKGLEGTWKDAEDGMLSQNPVAQGAVDSVIAVHLDVVPHGETMAHYWLAIGTSYHEVEALQQFVIELGSERILARNIDYWRHWVSAADRDFGPLPPELVHLFRRSLLVLRTQIDRGGAVIAANDSDIWQFNLDTYSYMWPRDGAITAQALDRAGFEGLSLRFLEFCTQKIIKYNFSASILAETGFLMHKYNPDGSVGSSWHPWSQDDEIHFPIQEDETALVLWALWHHYRLHHDIEAIRPLYASFAESAADFLLAFRDDKTGLPLPSYDLWEESRGVFTFTTGTVVTGLRAAAELARLFLREEKAQMYLRGAREVETALERYLYSSREARFVRGIRFKDGSHSLDADVDASLLGLVLFGPYRADDRPMERTARAVEQQLWIHTGIGGLARYPGDRYQRDGSVSSNIPGNAWIVCTLWLAQYRIAAARSVQDLERALPLLHWVKDRALASGVLPEQVHPVTGEFSSVSPLTWSHATLVTAMLDYVERHELLQRSRRTGTRAVTARADTTAMSGAAS